MNTTNARDLFIQNQLVEQIRAKKPAALKIVNKYSKGFIAKYGVALHSTGATNSGSTSTGGFFGKSAAEVDLNVVKADLVEELAKFYGIPLSEGSPLWPLTARHHTKLRELAAFRTTESGKKLANGRSLLQRTLLDSLTPIATLIAPMPTPIWTVYEQFQISRELQKLGEDAIACFTEAAIDIVRG